MDLGSNNLSNIEVLENVNFKELKHLHLNHNKISDIKVLEKIKFEKLERLQFEGNNVDKGKFNSLINSLKLKFTFII